MASPPSLYVLDHQNMEVRILLPTQLLDPTPVGAQLGTGGPALANPEALANNTIPQNRVVEFLDDLYALGLDATSTNAGVYKRGQGGTDQWGQVFTDSFGESDGSGLFIVHPNGVPTLIFLYQKSNQMWQAQTTNGTTWSSAQLSTPGFITVGMAFTFRDSIFFYITGSGLLEYNVVLNSIVAHGFTLDHNSQPTAPGFVIQDNVLFRAGWEIAGGTPHYAHISKLVAGVWTSVYDDTTRGVGVGQVSHDNQTVPYAHNCLFTDPSTGDLIAVFSGYRQGGTARAEVFQIIDPDGSPTVNPIGATVLDAKYQEGGGAANAERSWYVFVDNDTNPLVPVVFLYTFAPSGTTECWEWMGVGTPMALVGAGAGISSTQFSMPNVLFGGGHRSVISSRIEIGDPYNQDAETATGRKFYWRAIGTGGPNVGTFYASVGESYPDTVAPIVAASLVVENSLSNDLEAYYKFNNDGADSSVNGLDLTLTGSVPFATGLFGQAANFPGTDGNTWGRVGDDSALNVGNGLAPFGIQAWVNADAFPNSFGWVVSKSTPGTDGWALLVADVGSVHWSNQGGSGGFSTGVGLITAGAGWQHIVVTSDGATMRIYVDGLEEATAPAAAANLSTAALLLGNRPTGSRGFDGQMDEVAIWSRYLTPDEVVGLNNTGSGHELANAIQPATTPAISTNTITNITPDDGAVLYSVVLDLSSIGFGAGSPGRLMGDLT